MRANSIDDVFGTLSDEINEELNAVEDTLGDVRHDIWKKLKEANAEINAAGSVPNFAQHIVTIEGALIAAQTALDNIKRALEGKVE